MNERIKEIEKQCWKSTDSDPYAFFDVKKFAELIVRKCMACSTWVGKMNTNSCEPIHTAHAINQRIKQQFGVEE